MADSVYLPLSNADSRETTKGDLDNTVYAAFQADTPERRLLQAEAQLESFQGNRFSPEYYGLRAFARDARKDYEADRAQRKAALAAEKAKRDLAETASSDYLKKSVKELDAAQQELRNKAVAAQDALTEFLSARQELEDNLIRISGSLTEKGLTYEDGCKNGVRSDAVRLNGNDYVRPQSPETFLAAVTTRVAQARIRNHGGLLASYLGRYVGVRLVLNDVSLPKPATFPATSRALRADIHDMPGLFIEPDKDSYEYKQEVAKSKLRGHQPIRTP